MSKLVYLAGPIGRVSYDDATGWRELAAARLNALGIHTLSPMRFKEGLAGQKSIDLVDNSILYHREDYIFNRDFFDVKRCDLVLMKWQNDRPMTGTSMELAWAHAFQKPVIMWGAYPEHPMVRQAASVFVPSCEQACEVVEHFIW